VGEREGEEIEGEEREGEKREGSFSIVAMDIKSKQGIWRNCSTCRSVVRVSLLGLGLGLGLGLL
jgi:hypothetical protein